MCSLFLMSIKKTSHPALHVRIDPYAKKKLYDFLKLSGLPIKYVVSEILLIGIPVMQERFRRKG